MMIRKELDRTIAEALAVMSRDQLAAAVQIVAGMITDQYIESHPLPEGAPASVRAAMFNQTMATVLNCAAELCVAAAEQEPKEPSAEDAASAADIAAAAIAKARGTLN